jgi:hypothetical protein
MLRFLDLSYNTFKSKSLEQAIEHAKSSFQYLPFLKQHFHSLVILHTQEERKITSREADYQSFKGKTGFFWIPVRTNSHIAAYGPDLVLAQGLIFPFQLILLRWRLGKKTVIVVQHHGEQPAANRVKRFFQRWADKYIDGYFFTSLANGDAWIKAGVIANKAKCY